MGCAGSALRVSECAKLYGGCRATGVRQRTHLKPVLQLLISRDREQEFVRRAQRVLYLTVMTSQLAKSSRRLHVRLCSSVGDYK